MIKIIYFLLGFCLVGVGEASLALAKNLFVSPSGSDGISYAANDINNPWKTVAKAFTSVATGDNVYFRAGNYQITATISTRYNQNGTSDSPVIFSNYNGEDVTFTSSVSRTIYIDRDYYRVNGITFSAPGTFWYIGDTLSATYFRLSNCTGTVTMPGGSDNVAGIVFQSGRANNGMVESCSFHGPGADENINTAGVFVFRTQGVKVLNSEFYNIPRAIYYKHTCIPAETGIEFAYNYFQNNGSAIATVSQYANIHDNLFVGCGLLAGFDGGVGDDGTNAGSDHNFIHHNTFYNSTIDLIRSSSNDGSGAQYNRIADNVFTQTVRIFEYESLPHYTMLNNNLYILGDAIRNNRINYSLASWQIFYGQDLDSLSGEAVFEGGDTIDSILGYALTASSSGYQEASDGRDVGADVSLVGLQNIDSQVTASGNAPIVPNVESVEIASEISSSGVIFKDNFEDAASMLDKYVAYNDHYGDCAVVDGIGLGGSKGIRAQWETDQVDAGSFWYMFGKNPIASKIASGSDFRNIYWRFYVKTAEGWSGNPNKLTRATIFAKPDWSQAMIAHLWGQDGDLVLKMDPASGISEDLLATTGYNDFSGLTWLGAKKGTAPVYDPLLSNVWHFVEIHVRLNSSTTSDGLMEFWVDGNLEARSENLNWVGAWQEYGINAILFENYWNTGAPAHRERFLDNIVISTSPIGPALSPVNPLIKKTNFQDPDLNDAQGGFEVQVSLAQDESALVWAGGKIGVVDQLVVNNLDGKFVGALNGHISLEGNSLYYVRVRQYDVENNYSAWSTWKQFKTVILPPGAFKAL